MSAANPIPFISADDYFAGEADAEHRHEYVAGRVYMMAGASNTHNSVATTVTVLLGMHLRGKPCQPFNSDTKVRVRSQSQDRFYYPDAMVVCKPNPPGDSFQDQPVVVVEVSSPETRRIDEGEKREAYLSIPTLEEYVLIDTRSPRVVVHHRSAATGGFVATLYEGLDAVAPLASINCDLALADVYERITFETDPGGDEPG